jgi:hypothetical protein
MRPPNIVAFLPILAPILRPLSIPTSEAKAVKIKVKRVNLLDKCEFLCNNIERIKAWRKLA